MSLDWLPSSSPILGGVATGASRPQRPSAAPSNASPGFEQIAQRVRAEYLEMPGLSLTRDQAKCLWAVDGPLCDRLLAYLVYPTDCDKEIFDVALAVIRRATAETLASSQVAQSP